MNQEIDKVSRLAFLDATRGIAAVAVLLFHVDRLLPSDMKGDGTGWRDVVGLGCTGVSLFFLASAFSLSLSSVKRRDATLISFYVRRFFRIAPLYYLLMTLTLVSLGFGPPADAVAWILNITFTFNLVPGYQIGMVYAGWTIGVEMLFYAIFPFLFSLLGTAKRSLIALIGSIVPFFALDSVLQRAASAELFDDQQFPFFHMIFAPRFLPCFLLGILAYHVGAQIQKRRDGYRIGVTLLLVAAGAFALFYLRWRGNDVGREYSGRAILEQSFIFFTFLVGLMNAPIGLLVNSWTTSLGRRSYSLYLLHIPVIMVLFPYVHIIRAMGLSSDMAFVVSASVVLVVAAALSYVSYYVIERPGIHLGTWLMASRTPTFVQRTGPATD